MSRYKGLINPDIIPKHIAIIMDGNGRWAQKRSLPRTEGHKRGADVIEPLMDASIKLGIKTVSLFAFSVENWSRPKLEVKELWDLLKYYFQNNIERIKKKNIRIIHSGSTRRLPPSTKKIIQNAVDETKKNRKIVLNFCVNYGGRQDIVDGVNKWLKNRKPDEQLSVKKLERNLYTSGLPEVDLMIRTSGEFRISNFLLWQLAYAELVFMDVLWPDFNESHLYEAIYQYQQRERRFGKI